MNACFLYEFIRVIHMMHFASNCLSLTFSPFALSNFARHGQELQTLQLMRNFTHECVAKHIFIPHDDWYRIITNLCPRWIYIV